MRLREVLRSMGLAGAVIGLGAGLTVHMGGCASDPGRAVEPAPASDTQASALPPLPSLDLEATNEYQTASFAFG
jgi:hypothetical protein